MQITLALKFKTTRCDQLVKFDFRLQHLKPVHNSGVLVFCLVGVVQRHVGHIRGSLGATSGSVLGSKPCWYSGIICDIRDAKLG